MFRLFELDLHGKPRGSWRVLAFVLLCAATSNACGSDVPSFDYHVGRASGTFGRDQRLSAVLESGVLRPCPDLQSEEQLCARASNVQPRLRVANGRSASARVHVRLENVPSSQRFAARLLPLRSDEAQDPRCGREGLGPAPGSSVELAMVTGSELTLELPPCSAIALHGLLDAERRSYRVAILGSLNRDRAAMERLVHQLAAREPPLDFVHIVGSLKIPGELEPEATLEQVFAEAGLDWSFSLSGGISAELQRGLADRFGSLDHVSLLGQARVLVLNTAGREVTRAQLDWLETMEPCRSSAACPPGVALMWSLPVTPGRFELDAFRSAIVSRQLLTALAARGFELLIGGTREDSRSGRHGGFRLELVGTVERDEAWTELILHRPWTGHATCMSTMDPLRSSALGTESDAPECTEGQRCHRGLCLPSCEGGCAEGLRCADGVCRRPCEGGCAEDSPCEGGYCREGPWFELVRHHGFELP